MIQICFDVDENIWVCHEFLSWWLSSHTAELSSCSQNQWAEHSSSSQHECELESFWTIWLQTLISTSLRHHLCVSFPLLHPLCFYTCSASTLCSSNIHCLVKFEWKIQPHHQPASGTTMNERKSSSMIHCAHHSCHEMPHFLRFMEHSLNRKKNSSRGVESEMGENNCRLPQLLNT